MRSAANDTFISTSVRRPRCRRILLLRLSCLKLGNPFGRSDQGKICQAEEKPMLHYAGDAGKPFGQRFWVGNAAKRCVEDAVAAVGNEGRAAPGPERDRGLQAKLARALFDSPGRSPSARKRRLRSAAERRQARATRLPHQRSRSCASMRSRQSSRAAAPRRLP